MLVEPVISVPLWNHRKFHLEDKSTPHVKVTDSPRYRTSNFGVRVNVGFAVCGDQKNRRRYILIDLGVNKLAILASSHIWRKDRVYF